MGSTVCRVFFTLLVVVGITVGVVCFGQPESVEEGIGDAAMFVVKVFAGAVIVVGVVAYVVLALILIVFGVLIGLANRILSASWEPLPSIWGFLADSSCWILEFLGTYWEWLWSWSTAWPG